MFVHPEAPDACCSRCRWHDPTPHERGSSTRSPGGGPVMVVIELRGHCRWGPSPVYVEKDHWCGQWAPMRPPSTFGSGPNGTTRTGAS